MKKFIIILLIMVAVAGLVFFLIWRQALLPETEPGDKLSGPDNALDQGARQLDFMSKLSAAEQEIIKNSADYKNLLKLQRICNRPTNTGEQKEECEEDLILNQIVILKNEALCAELSQKRDDCYLTLATIKEDSAICQNISVSEKKEVCQNSLALAEMVIAENLSECQKFSNDFYKNLCIVKFIDAKNDPALCADPIIASWGEDGADRCRAKLLYDQALEKQDIKICDQITVENIRQNCRNFLTKPAQ